MYIFKNKKPLTRKQANRVKFGCIFIVNDKVVFNHKGKEKARRVVLLGKKNGSLLIAPIRHRPPSIMEISNFDGKRCIRLDKSVLVGKNKVYSKNGFKGTKNDYLSKSEKVALKKKMLGYK